MLLMLLFCLFLLLLNMLIICCSCCLKCCCCCCSRHISGDIVYVYCCCLFFRSCLLSVPFVYTQPVYFLLVLFTSCSWLLSLRWFTFYCSWSCSTYRVYFSCSLLSIALVYLCCSCFVSFRRYSASD